MHSARAAAAAAASAHSAAPAAANVAAEMASVTAAAAQTEMLHHHRLGGGRTEVMHHAADVHAHLVAHHSAAAAAAARRVAVVAVAAAAAVAVQADPGGRRVGATVATDRGKGVRIRITTTAKSSVIKSKPQQSILLKQITFDTYKFVCVFKAFDFPKNIFNIILHFDIANKTNCIPKNKNHPKSSQIQKINKI